MNGMHPKKANILGKLWRLIRLAKIKWNIYQLRFTDDENNVHEAFYIWLSVHVPPKSGRIILSLLDLNTCSGSCLLHSNIPPFLYCSRIISLYFTFWILIHSFYSSSSPLKYTQFVLYSAFCVRLCVSFFLPNHTNNFTADAVHCWRCMQRQYCVAVCFAPSHN